MRRTLSFITGFALVGAMALVVPPGAGASTGETLFDDDFSAGDDAWTTSGGDWSVNDGAYEQTVDAGNARAFAGDSGWDDVRVEADVTPTFGDGLTAVLGRVQAEETYYYLTLRYSGTFEINRLVDGSRTEIASVPFEVEVGETYRLGLHMFGDELTGYVDGVPLVQGIDDAFASGEAGLKTFNTTAVFDNALVSEATGPGDEPEDPGNGGDDPDQPADTVVDLGDLPILAQKIARRTLRDGDGWGSAGDGTTGGATAEDTQVHLATSRDDLVTALGGDNAGNAGNSTPKIIFVDGEIDGREDGDGGVLTCDDFADPEYDFDEYLATYDPEVWGRDEDPSGPLEDARERSMRNQQRHTEISVGSNTTLVGLPGATLRHMTLMFNRADNVIVRNLTFEDATDCFPRWRPTDGEFGNWNSNYDSVSVRRGSNFWFDHNTFRSSTEALPEYFDRKFETYDGLLDISHTADHVTVSNGVFADHDKVMLIGSTNNPDSGDPGRLNVTLRHNVFDGLGQRAPRMRFGQIDVYNNYYKAAVTTPNAVFDYLWGVGVESQGYFENNYVDLRGSGVDPSQVIRNWGGTQLTEKGTWVRTGWFIGRPTSLLDAYHDAGNPPLSDVSWTPELRRGPVLPTVAVPALVGTLAGAGSFVKTLATGLGGTPPEPPDEEPPEGVWQSTDIGAADGSATANEAGDAVTITGQGKFESGGQQFHFVHTEVTGDFTITARLDEVDFAGVTNGQGRVGVLFAPDLTTAATDFLYAGAMVVADGTYRRTDRLEAGNSGTTTVSPEGDGDVHVRITRTGDQHQAAFSADGGATFTPASTRTFAEPLPDTVQVGLAVNSGGDVQGSATFSDVTITDGDGDVLVGPDEFGELGE